VNTSTADDCDVWHDVVEKDDSMKNNATVAVFVTSPIISKVNNLCQKLLALNVSWEEKGATVSLFLELIASYQTRPEAVIDEAFTTEVLKLILSVIDTMVCILFVILIYLI
jgi:hypothetical protein